MPVVFFYFLFLNRIHVTNQKSLPLATQPLFDSTHPLSTHIYRQHKAPLRTTSVFFPVGWNCRTLVCGTVYSRFQLDPDLLGKPGSFTKPTPTGMWVDECLPDWKMWSGSRKFCGIVQQRQRQTKPVKTGICGVTFFLVFCWTSWMPNATAKKSTHFGARCRISQPAKTNIVIMPIKKTSMQIFHLLLLIRIGWIPLRD